MRHSVILPMAFYVFYMGALSVFMLFSRIKGIKSGQVDYKYFKTYNMTKPLPESLVVMGRHYDNQFQVPMLFMITCCVYLILDQSSFIVSLLAWFFVFTRLVHTFIHLGNNNVLNRARVFAAGWITLMLMWGNLITVVQWSK